MNKHYLSLILTILLISCGGEAENTSNELNPESTTIREEVQINQTEKSMEEEIVEDVKELSGINKTKEQDVDKNVPEQKKSLSKLPAKPIVNVPNNLSQPDNPIIIEEFKPNHQPWDEITKKHVSSLGKVNYKGMKADLTKISTYLEHLKNTPPKKDWSKNEKLTYWINLYNASTVYLITSNYPTSSITKLSGGKPWDKKFVKSGDKIYSLNDIENVIIRPQFKDPRIHAALNCAAVSCPKLLNGAYMPNKLSNQLDLQTIKWIGDVSKNKLTKSKVQISQIFDWYKDDFKAGGGVIAFINKYRMKGDKVEPNAKITYLEYDWALNE